MSQGGAEEGPPEPPALAQVGVSRALLSSWAAEARRGLLLVVGSVPASKEQLLWEPLLLISWPGHWREQHCNDSAPEGSM